MFLYTHYPYYLNQCYNNLAKELINHQYLPVTF